MVGFFFDHLYKQVVKSVVKYRFADGSNTFLCYFSPEKVT